MSVMIDCIVRSNALEAENQEFIKEISEIVESNGFKCKSNKHTLVDLFEHTEFADFVFDRVTKEVTPLHKAAIRKLLACAKELATQTFGKISVERQERRSKAVEDGEIGEGDNTDQIKILGELLARCSQKAKSKDIHIETSKELSKQCGNMGATPHFMLPSSYGVNTMARELKKSRTIGIPHPFVRTSLSKFVPEWHNETCGDGFLLAPSVLMPTLTRWAMAAQANGMVPLNIGLAHADICMRAASEAREKGQHACTAAAYVELRQKALAEMCLKGASDFNIEQMLSTFDRETFEQACQTAETKTSNGCKHNAPSKYGRPISSAYKDVWHTGGHNESWSKNSTWSNHGQTKRQYDSQGKTWDNKRRKF